jgi:hypothetical protein
MAQLVGPATPVANSGAAVLPGSATPVVIVAGGPVLAGPATPIAVQSGGSVLPGPATPIQYAGGSVLPGRPIPVSVQAANSEVAAWQSAVVAKGGTVSTSQFASVDQLTTSLKSAGVWALLDRLWLFAAENAAQALTDIVASASATAVNSPTFTVGRGYQGNGTSSYIDSGFNIAVGTPHFTITSCSWSTWVETAGTGAACGNDNGAYSRFILAAATREMSLLSQTGGGTFPSSLAFALVQRTSSAAVAGYDSVGQQGSNATLGGTPTSLYNRDIYILANDYPTGTPVQFCNARLAYMAFGASLSPAQITALYNALRSYMTAQGVA